MIEALANSPIMTRKAKKPQAGKAAKAPRDPSVVSHPKAFLYKTARYTLAPFPHSLEGLLRSALEKLKTLSDRRYQTTSTGADGYHVLSHWWPAEGMTFAEVIFAIPDAKAQGAKLDWSKAAVDPELGELKNADGELLTPLETVLTFGVSENRVVLAPSAGLGAPQLETYLNWLLGSAKIDGWNDPKLRLLLGNHVSSADREKLGRIKAVRFEATTGGQTETAATDGTSQTMPARAKVPWEIVTGMLTSLGLTEKAMGADFDLTTLEKTEPVEVQLSLSWSSRKRESEHAALTRIAVGLRHVDTEFDYRIETANGPVTKADIVLREMKSVRCRSTRPLRDDLATKMAEWLNKLQSSGRLN